MIAHLGGASLLCWHLPIHLTQGQYSSQACYFAGAFLMLVPLRRIL